MRRRRRAVRIGDADAASRNGRVLYDVVGLAAQLAVSDERIFMILRAAAAATTYKLYVRDAVIIGRSLLIQVNKIFGSIVTAL